MHPQFKLFAARLMDESGAINRIASEFGGQRNRTDYFGAVSGRHVNNRFRRIVYQSMVVGFNPQSEF